MPATVVLALGGNAITRPGEPGTIPQQFEHTAETLEHLQPLFRSSARIVITHGNGPQIGNILIRVEEGECRVPRLPVDTCVADSQGGMGYMIQRLALEMFRREGIRRHVATVITQVLVAGDDPEFTHPTKPIGQYYRPDEADRVRLEKPHWNLSLVDRGLYRRVVPSPRPLQVLESEAIRALLTAGVVVIACGGGGIPVAWDHDRIRGVEGVVDKDLASCLVATSIRAQQLLIVTSVDQAAIRYGRPDQQWLGNLSVAEAQAHLAAGEFPPGSMGPKIAAGIQFIEEGGEECIITSAERVGDAIEGRAGTHIQ